MSPRHGGCPGATPGSRTNFYYLSRAPARAAESPKLSLPGAAPGRLANFQWGRGRQEMHLPCKQAHAGALPVDSTSFNCGENEIQASLISSASVGATPTPATNLGRCSGCRSVKPVSQTTVGSDDWSITSTSHQPSPAAWRRAKAAASKHEVRRRAFRWPARLRLGRPFVDP